LAPRRIITTTFTEIYRSKTLTSSTPLPPHPQIKAAKHKIVKKPKIKSQKLSPNKLQRARHFLTGEK